MEFGDVERIRLVSGEFEPSFSSSSANFCRICHEEEHENSSFESPCSCSGTLKFAHRRCIQRWCDEKGDNVCEICLQKFEPGYVVANPPPAKPYFVDVVLTIRESLAATSQNYESENHTLLFITRSEPEREYIVPSRSSDRSAKLCRLIILMFTIILLFRHLFAVLSDNAEDYAFTLATIFVLRAMGVLLPFCLVMRLITVIQNAQKLHIQDNEVSDIQGVEDDLEQQ